MISLLQNSPKLTTLYMGANTNINTDCFVLLVQTLHGTGILNLFIDSCNVITNISSLDTYNLPCLQKLGLSGNNIGREGCTTLANLLRNEESSLIYLGLDNTGIDNEGAELLATSLENNNKLETLCLQGNGITEKGYKAFSKLLVDVSSVESTHNSNHTLKVLKLPPLTGAGMYWLREIVRGAIHIMAIVQLFRPPEPKLSSTNSITKQGRAYVVYRVSNTPPLAVSLQILNPFWYHISLH